jgi:hypothetical protein
MGRVMRVLAERTLPERLPETGQMLVDLAENLHVHHRDMRQEFSLPEFFEYVDNLNAAAADVRRYLADNPEYREQAYRDTLLKATGGPEDLVASPKPHESTYWPRRLRIELEHPHSLGEVHVHWRDFRRHVTLEEFRIVAGAFSEALAGMEQQVRLGYKPRTKATEADLRKRVQKKAPPPGPGHFRRKVGQ